MSTSKTYPMSGDDSDRRRRQRHRLRATGPLPVRARQARVGKEWDFSGTPIFGRARFDARELSTGRWEGSRSKAEEPEEAAHPVSRARRRGSRFRTG